MPPTATEARPTRDQLDPAALELIRRHGPELMASARKWAATPEDAEDAYQRGLEILLTKAPTADPDQLVPWLKTVVKHEAFAARRQRDRHTPPGGMTWELFDAPGDTTAADQAESVERLRQGAEAMRRLKPQEVRALVLRAEGLSYQEICEETGWTYTKVNRALAEGRKAFATRLEGIQSGAECVRLAPTLSAVVDGEAGAEDLTVLRAHVRTCLACRARLRDYRAAPARVAALLPPAAAVPLLESLRGAFAGASGWLHERSVSLAVRWHQAAELAAGHKVAAVAASSAVLAGGGAVTVVTVDGGDRPPAVRPTPGSSVAPSMPSAPTGIEIAEPRHRTTSSGGATGQAPARDETAPADRGPAPTARPAGESSAPGPSAGEFTPDPAPAEPAPTRLKRPARAAGSEPKGGGEFSP